MTVPSIFKPAVERIAARWEGLDASTRAKLEAALPDLAERQAVLTWNAVLSTTDARLREPCQAIYEALSAWDHLSVIERIAVFMAGVGPMAKLARAQGLVGGA